MAERPRKALLTRPQSSQRDSVGKHKGATWRAMVGITVVGDSGSVRG